MSNIVISVEYLSKAYPAASLRAGRLGQVSTWLRQSTRRIGAPPQAGALTGRAAGTLTYDMKLWRAKMRRKPNLPDRFSCEAATQDIFQEKYAVSGFRPPHNLTHQANPYPR